jgi:hypothetical protein
MSWVDKANDFWVVSRDSTDSTILYDAAHFCECHGWRKFGYPFEGYSFEQLCVIAGVQWSDDPSPRVDQNLPTYVQEHNIVGEMSRINR